MPRALKKYLRSIILVILMILLCGGLAGCSESSPNDNPNSASSEPITLHGKVKTVSIMTNTYFQNFGGVHSTNESDQKLDHYLDRISNINDYSVHIYAITLHHDVFHKIDYNVTFIRKGSHHTESSDYDE